MDEYDIAEAFRRIEEELMASIMRNMARHRAEEVREGFNWSMWQAEQLKSLEKYKQANRKRYGKEFRSINREIDTLIREYRAAGNMDQEVVILNAIKRGFRSRQNKTPSRTPLQGEFFKLNDRKLEALVKATTNDMERAETAILRMANDEYRKAIFNAQVYANTGAGTYEQAVDMATKDMVSKGLTCVEYANGARHSLSAYANMALRTAGKRAYLAGEGEMRQKWGIATVIVNKRGNPCPKCLPFCGKVLIDDVWSGGSREGGSYPLMSTAIAAGLYHPNCRDVHTTYFPGISTADDTWTEEELEKVERAAKLESRQQYARRQYEKFGRLSRYSLDPDNRKMYGRKAQEWGRAYLKTGGMDIQEYAESKRPLGSFRALPQDRVVDVLRKDSEEWIQTLTDEEKRAIQKYTYNSGDKKPNRFFERLNAMLRGDIPGDERLESYAETISGAIKKSRLKHDVIAFRGMGVDPTDGADIGEIIRPGQFFSTSVTGNRSFKDKYKIIIYAKKGSKAAYIEKISFFPNQRELLLDNDCNYRVISRKGNEIELEVL
ncbi:MAG: minor capsid protein [Lachnospiraceae bacterium]|jgi:hypothetical protein|nr:minor capsid protein [Lachnospiraceae bacterium]